MSDRNYIGKKPTFPSSDEVDKQIKSGVLTEGYYGGTPNRGRRSSGSVFLLGFVFGMVFGMLLLSGAILGKLYL